ncbi:MAG: peptidoglycan DD-metalloendopeptidase family protein [Desulfuromonadales bacterium]|nr:peptidoglycan DD-metalloendopeptidase family protein [Desulfuromonadales bacterium]
MLAAFLWLPSGLVGCAPTGVYHTVQPGQTLYRIAKTYQIPEAELARANRITDPTRLKVGQKLYVPGVTQPRQVATYSPAKPVSGKPTSPQTVSSSARKETQRPAPLSSQSATKSSPPSKTTKQPISPQKGIFIWPVKGKIVSKFGAKSGAANKGVEISSAEGKPVAAAAPGKVIYSGSGIRGYGNLIIIEHADDYFTVYGYNKQNLVKTNDFVGQGDRIALSGQPQNGQSPRLHFEIRRGKSAVNPIFYLP